MLDVRDERIVGKRLQDVLDLDAVLQEGLGFLNPGVTEGQFTAVWAEATDGDRRCYDIVITDLSTKRDDVSGRVAIIHNVTEKQCRKQQLTQQAAELERQNDHLEEFASAVSHDLRSPLNVAEAMTLEADVTRLQQVLENLFRNPIERGVQSGDSQTSQVRQNGGSQPATAGVDAAYPERDPLTLTVGRSGTGFFVADDGAGTPPGERDRVLEEGYTTSENGTGLGLAIVNTIIEAHGGTCTSPRGTTAAPGSR